MSDNPYASPLSQGSGGYADGTPSGNDAFVRQVPIVGVLMIVFGGLELLMGLYYCVVGALLPENIFEAQIRRGAQIPGDQVEFMKQFTYGVILAMGAGGIIGGFLRIVGGIQVVRFRSYLLGIVGNIAGLGGIATCYCAPTSIGVTVYGLIILFQSSVHREFARRAG